MPDTSFWSLKFGDILMILAVGLSPLVAVLIQKWFESRGATLSQRRWIFKTLMTTRTAPLDLNHVQALNMIALEFRDRKYETLRRKWELYLRHLNITSVDQRWFEVRNDLLADLLVEMGRVLGYKFDTAHVTNEAYRPRYHGNVQSELDEIRQRVLEILRSTKAFPVALFPGNPDAALKFQESIVEVLKGHQSLSVELKRPTTGPSTK